MSHSLSIAVSEYGSEGITQGYKAKDVICDTPTLSERIKEKKSVVKTEKDHQRRRMRRG